MIDFEIGFVVGALSAVFVYCCYRAWVLWQTVPIEQNSDEMTYPIGLEKFFGPDPEGDAKLAKLLSNEPFAVSGKPHRVPWNIRKRELTEAAKKKRRQYESFQEID